ncbi:MAG: MarR family transcriptional regulator [Lachnospiraceae bacterium]|nr:MarR family transcriptional regulator [Lachnospiraceae bacterium]
MADKYDVLKLDNQLCFPLYAVSKEIVRKYTPFLSEIDLTYTQYIVMMVMWEHKEVSVKELGQKLFLDSGTLTPLLKTLEKKGFVKRERSKDDERFLVVSITDEGMELREKAVDVPTKIGGCITLSAEDAMQLYTIVRKMLGQFEERPLK